MKKSIVVLCMLFSTACFIQGQKYRIGQPAPKPTDPAAFTIRVHISASHLRLNCSGSDTKPPDLACGYGLYADAVLDGKKVELWGQSKIEKYQRALLAPGDYTAQLTKDDHSANQSVVSQSYKLLLPDSTIWVCQLSGISE